MTRKKKSEPKSNSKFEIFASKITKATGSTGAFFAALLAIIIWLVTGPVFNYSDTWQLVINTGTTIITFLMIFVIQQSQNRDTAAIQLKLNELIASNDKASNRLVDTEDLTEEELRILKKFYVKISEMAKDENDVHASHSVDEAEDNHESKINQHTEKLKKKSLR